MVSYDELCRLVYIISIIFSISNQTRLNAAPIDDSPANTHKRCIVNVLFISAHDVNESPKFDADEKFARVLQPVPPEFASDSFGRIITRVFWRQ